MQPELFATIRWDWRPLKAMISRVNSAGAGPKVGNDVAKVIAVTYLSQVSRDFIANSKGGGAWKALAPGTLKMRRNKNKKSAMILRDTDTMFKALQYGGQGNLLEIVGRNIVRVGVKHIPHGQGSPISLQELVYTHNTGAGNVPQRTIFNKPSPQTVRRVEGGVRGIFTKMGRELPKVGI